MVTTIKAYAKINLALNIKGKLDNGYHDVDMVMLPLELHDIIEFELLPKGYETYITSDDESLPTDESNLTIKTFLKLRETFNIEQNFRIHIYKRIPICAGLGGGSSDAAAMLHAVLKMTKHDIPLEKLIDVGKTIGADVPFGLYNRPAECQGIGEKLNFFHLKKKYYVLLIKPLEGVSTAEAYHRYDKLEVKPQSSNIKRLITALENDDEEVIASEMKNALQDCAISLVPEIKEIIQKLKEDGFKMTMMSGSGSTVFALSKDWHSIWHESKKFSKDKYQVIVTATLQ